MSELLLLSLHDFSTSDSAKAPKTSIDDSTAMMRRRSVRGWSLQRRGAVPILCFVFKNVHVSLASSRRTVLSILALSTHWPLRPSRRRGERRKKDTAPSPRPCLGTQVKHSGVVRILDSRLHSRSIARPADIRSTMRSVLVKLLVLAVAAIDRRADAFSSLAGVTARSVESGDDIDLGDFLSASSSGGDKSMVILGTYAADFNAIEYGQRLRYYLPELKKRGITKVGFVLNCEEESARKLCEMLDLEDESVTLMVDPLGAAGRKFGVGTGWRADDDEMSPYLKLFGMLFGLGAWATLPAVIGGYIGNPFTPQKWIEDALAVGQRKNRWPDNALELDEATGEVSLNKFTELPVVGEWPRRPLELATLRLQNMLDISIKNWKELAPSQDALDAGVLTQLGGCIICQDNGDVLFDYKDPGICAVANFEDILKKIPTVKNLETVEA